MAMTMVRSAITPAGITIMTEQNINLFRLMTLLSPAFPIGAFSYSHGLEYAAECGLLTDEASLEAWIRTALTNEIGPVNGFLLRQSWQAARTRDAAALLDALSQSRAMVATGEFELETTSQGGAFLSTMRQADMKWAELTWADALLLASPGPVPLAFALGVATATIPLDQVMTGFFQAILGHLISAALRLIRLGQTAGQRIQMRLEPAVIQAAHAAIHRPAGDVGTATPVLELCSILHETQYTRLFRS
jgi:urease accessory protein